MSVRLFHKDARIVIATAVRGGSTTWYALHRRPVDWSRVFVPALRLLGYRPVPAPAEVRFGDGALRWTAGPLWTTIRLQLPPCPERKAALLASGLLKAARYAAVTEQEHAERT